LAGERVAPYSFRGGGEDRWELTLLLFSFLAYPEDHMYLYFSTKVGGSSTLPFISKAVSWSR